MFKTNKHTSTLFLCTYLVNCALAVQVSSFTELQLAVEVNQDAEIIIDVPSIQLERPLEFNSGVAVAIRGVPQDDDSLPILIGSTTNPTTHFIVSTATTQVTMSNLALAPSQESVEPNADVRGTEPFTLRDGAQLATNDIQILGGLCHGWLLTSDGYCVSGLSLTVASWDVAEAACSARNYHLPSVHNEKTLDDLFSLVETASDERMWLGAKVDAQGKPFEWSDGSDPQDFPWPLSTSQVSGGGTCVYIDGEVAGLWSATTCNEAQVEHPYVCAYPLGDAASAFDSLLGTTQGVQHTGLVVQVSSFEEFITVFDAAAASSTSLPLTVAYTDAEGVARSATVSQSVGALTVQVKLSGTSLPSTLVALVDSSIATTPVQGASQGQDIVFDIAVTGIPRLLQVITDPTDSTSATISTVQLVVNEAVVFESQMDPECFNKDSIMEGTFTPYLVVGLEIGVSNGQHFSQDFTETGCNTMSLWTHPSRPSPLQLHVEGTNLSNLVVSAAATRTGPQVAAQTGWISLQVPSSGTLELPMEKLTSSMSIPATFQVDAIGSSCLGALSLRYYSAEIEILSSFAADITIEECPGLCGNIYDTANQCVTMGTSDIGQLATVTLDFLATEGTCSVLEQGRNSASITSFEMCTFQGNFTLENFNAVFDDSSDAGFSTFVFDFLPSTIPTPPSSLPKNRILVLDGLQLNVEDAQGETTVAISNFQIFGEVRFESVLVTDGLLVSGNGQVTLGNSEVVGRIVLQDNAKLIMQGGVVQLDAQPSFVLQDLSSIEITGAFVPKVSNQASALLETTSSGSVTVSSLVIEDPSVDIGLSLSVARLPVGQVQYEYTVCSNDDPNAVLLDSLTLIAEVNDEAECQKACDESTCTGFGLDVNDSTNELTCHLCTEVECVIACEDDAGVQTTGVYMAATNQPGFVKFDGCFAASTQPNPIKVVPSLSASPSVQELKCNAVCDLYLDCGATRIQGSECQLYPRTALASEGCSPSLSYNIRFPLEVAQFASLPLNQAKHVSPQARIVVGTRTLDECTVLCSHHQACDLFQHDETQDGLCTLLTEDNDKSAPWITSGLPSGSDEVFVSIGPQFPRVTYEEWSSEKELIVNAEDALSTSRLDEADCATECSTIANCIAFQFAELGSISSDTDNCLLHTLSGMRSLLRAPHAGPSPFKLMVATNSEDFFPIGGNTNKTLGDGVEVDEISLKYENVFSFDTCKALCFIQAECDVIEYDVVSYTCVVVPFKASNDAFGVLRENFNVTNSNATLFQLGSENPFDNDVVYTRVEGECLNSVPVGSSEQSASLAACKSFCNIHPDCHVFIFNEADGCVLYESISVPEDETSCSTGPEAFYVASHDPDAESYFHIPFDACFVKQIGDEGVIVIPEANGAQQCGDACKAEAKCRAYSFDQEAGCVLRDDNSLEFDGCTNPVDSYLELFSHYFTRANTTSLGSVELFTVEDEQVTLVQCESLCIVFEKCVAIAVSSFTFEETTIGGKCVLLTTSNNGEVGGDTFEKDGNILVVLDSYNPYLFTPVSNLRVAPSSSKTLEDVPAFIAATQTICEALCESLAACNSITYHMETHECTFFQANSWTQDEYSTEIRSSNLHYSVGFEKFVNQVPDFARITARGEYFASTEAFQVLSNVPTATACQRACLEAEEQCGLAHYFQQSKSCSLFREGTKISNVGLAPTKFCQEVHLVGFQALDIGEIILLDALGAAMYDTEVTLVVNDVEEGHEIVDGLANTIFSTEVPRNNLVATFCAPKPVHKVKVRYDSVFGTFTRYALYIPETRPEYNQPLYNTPDFAAIKFREVDSLKQRSELGDEVFDLPSDRIEHPDSYILREHDCVGSNGHISSLRPRLPTECAAHCDNMPRCVAFNYDKSTGTCYFTNDILAVPLENCKHLDAYIDMNSISFSVPPQRCCSVIRVEMDSSSGRELDLCEIEFLDAAGNAMVDFQAGSRVTSSEGDGSAASCVAGKPECAFDGNTGGCFVGTSGPLAFLETTVCTPRPVEQVRIVSRGESSSPLNAVRNAKVYFTSSQVAEAGSRRAIGVIEYFDEINSEIVIDTHGYCGLPATGLGAPAELANTALALPLPSYGCSRVIIESAPGSHLHLCEVEVYDENGQLMFDSKAASRATASSVKNLGPFSNPSFAADGNDATDSTRYGCFESDPNQSGPAFWETSFCSREAIGSIRVVGATDENGPVAALNGATVTVMESTGKRDVVGTLSHFDVMGHSSQVVQVIPGSVDPSTTNSRGANLYCGTVMVDLEASEAGSQLSLCNVEVLDHAGVAMFDSSAIHTARAKSTFANSGFEPRRAVDDNTSTNGSQRNNCYKSNAFSGAVRRAGGVDQRVHSWWKAEFCTPRPIEAVRIQRRTDSAADLALSFGASVFFGNHNSEMRFIGRLLTEDTTVLDTTTQCVEAFVSQETGQLQVNEVEFIPSSGAAALDTQQLASATILPTNTNSFPDKAVDSDTSTFYRTPPEIPSDLSTTWKSSFCSNLTPRALRVTTGNMNSDVQVLAKTSTDAPRRIGVVEPNKIGLFQISRHCTRVTVELDGGSGRMLQLLEVRVRNAHGFEILDFNAASRSMSNFPAHPTRVPPTSISPVTNNVQHPMTGRFFSAEIPTGQIGSWSTVYCVAQKVAHVEVELPQDPILATMNGARVYVTDGRDQVQRLIGEIQGDVSTNSRVHKFAIASDLCPIIRIEKSPIKGSVKPLKVCYAVRGSEPYPLHYGAQELASSSGGNDPAFGATESTPCYESNPVSNGQTAYWQSSFCAPSDQFQFFMNDDRTASSFPLFGAKFKVVRNNKFVEIGSYDFTSGDPTWRTDLPLAYDLPTGCTNVRVELEGGNNKFLQISEVRVLDAEGQVMIDPEAAARATGTATPGNGQEAHRLPSKAVDGVLQSGSATSFNGYHSKEIPSGETGFWQTTFCVPRTVAIVEIHGRTHPTNSIAQRMNGAKVYVDHDSDLLRPTGPLRGLPLDRTVTNFVEEKNGHIWRHMVEFGSRLSKSISLPPESCIDVKVRVPGRNVLNLCEIEVRDAQGRVMLDPAAGVRSPIYQQDVSPYVLADGDPGVGTSRCAVLDASEGFFAMTHQVRFCTPRPVASINLYMDSPKEIADRIELYVTARHGAVGRENKATRVGEFNEETKSHHFTLDSCDTVRVEMPGVEVIPSVERIRVCRAKAMDQDGSNVIGSFALSGGAFATNPFFGSCATTFGWWEGTYCGEQQPRVMNIVGETNTRNVDTTDARMFLYPNQVSKPLELGKLGVSLNGGHTGLYHVPDLVELTNVRNSRFGACSTVSIDLDQGDWPLGLCKVRVFDAAGTEMIDRSAVLTAKSFPAAKNSRSSTLPVFHHLSLQPTGTAGCFETLPSEGHRHWEATMCLPRPIARITVVGYRDRILPETQVLGEVKVTTRSLATPETRGFESVSVQHFGTLLAEPSDGNEPEFRLLPQVEPEPDYPNYDDIEVLGSNPGAAGSSCVNVEVVTMRSNSNRRLRFCEIDLLDTRGELIPKPPADQILFEISGGFSKTGAKPEVVFDGLPNTCYESHERKGRMSMAIRFCGVERPVGGVRIDTSFTRLTAGSRVYLTTDDGVRMLLGTSPAETISLPRLDFMIDSAGVEHFGEFLLPYDNADFGEVAIDGIDVGKKMDEALHFSFQTKESCAALCSEWFQCSGFFLQSRSCSLRPGLAVNNFIDGITFPDVVAVPPPTVPQPTPLPTATPTTSPTSVLSTIHNFERTLGPFAAMNPEQGWCLPSLRTTETSFVEAIQLEACSTLCRVMPECRAMKWNLKGCQLYTGRTGLDIEPCGVDDIGSVHLISLERLLDNDKAFRMESIGNRYPTSSTSGSESEGNESTAEQCANTCLETSSCSLSEFFVSNGIPVCKLHETITGSLQGVLQAGELSDNPRTLAESSLKVRKSNYQELKGRKVVNVQLLSTLRNFPFLGCMALCEISRACDGFNFNSNSHECSLVSGIPTKSDDVTVQFIPGTNFYRSSFVHRRSQFGGPDDFVRLANNVDRSECEGACRLLGAGCQAVVHTLTGECRLTRFAQTKPGILRNNLGFCLVKEADGIIRPAQDSPNCLEVVFQYVFTNDAAQSSLGRIRLASDPSTCLARRLELEGSNVVRREGLKELDCDNEEQGGIDLSWTTDAKVVNTLHSNVVGDVDETTIIHLCSQGVDAGIRCPDETWGLDTKDHSSVRFVDVYVDAEALEQSQTVSNPNFLFFQWLYSAEGKTARSLHAKMRQFSAVVKSIQAAITRGTLVASGALAIFSNIQAPIDLIDNTILPIVKKAKTFSKIAKLGEKIPYVKFVAKPIRLLLDIARNTMSNGFKAVVKAVRRTDKLLGPLDAFEDRLVEASLVFASASTAIQVASSSMLSLAFCASTSELQSRIAIMERKMKDAIKAADDFMSLGLEVPKATKVLGTVQNLFNKFVFKPAETVVRAFRPVSKVMNAFSWLETVFTTQVCFKLPIVGRVCLPTLEDIGNFVSRIIRKIRKIPFVGGLVRLAERVVNNVLKAIFKAIRIPLPSIPINFSFADELFDGLSVDLDQLLDRIGNMTDLGQLLPLNFDIAQVFDISLLPDINNLGIVPDANLGLQIPGVDLPSADEIGEVIGALFDEVGELGNLLGKLLQEKPVCTKPAPAMRCEDLFREFGPVGDALRAELGASDCPLPLIPSCGEWEIAGLTAIQDELSVFGERILQKAFGVGSDDGQGRRRLSSESFSMEITLLGKNGLFNFILPELQEKFSNFVNDNGVLSTPKANFGALSMALDVNPGFLSFIIGRDKGEFRATFEFIFQQVKASLLFRRTNYEGKSLNPRDIIRIERLTQYVRNLEEWLGRVQKLSQTPIALKVTSPDGQQTFQNVAAELNSLARKLAERAEEVLDANVGARSLADLNQLSLAKRTKAARRIDSKSKSIENSFLEDLAEGNRLYRDAVRRINAAFTQNQNNDLKQDLLRFLANVANEVFDAKWLRGEEDFKLEANEPLFVTAIKDKLRDKFPIFDGDNFNSFADAVNVDVFRALLDFKFNPEAFGNLIGGVTNVEMFSKSFDAFHLELKEAQNSISFLDPWSLGTATSGSVLYGPIEPVSNLMALLDHADILLERLFLQPEDEMFFEFAVGLAVNLPFGFTVTLSGPNSCSLLGFECFDGPVCPVFGFVPGVETGRSDGAECTCGEQCESGQCSVNGALKDGTCLSLIQNGTSNGTLESELPVEGESPQLLLSIGTVTFSSVAGALFLGRKRIKNRYERWRQGEDGIGHGNTDIINAIGLQGLEDEPEMNVVDESV